MRQKATSCFKEEILVHLERRFHVVALSRWVPEAACGAGADLPDGLPALATIGKGQVGTPIVHATVRYVKHALLVPMGTVGSRRFRPHWKGASVADRGERF